MQELMIRRELAKDPKLATESWDRFLPKFRKRHLTSAEKSAKKRERQDGKGKIQESISTKDENAMDLDVPEPPKKKKKIYTPFPPPQQPRKVRLNLLGYNHEILTKNQIRWTFNWNLGSISSNLKKKRRERPHVGRSR